MDTVRDLLEEIVKMRLLSLERASVAGQDISPDTLCLLTLDVLQAKLELARYLERNLTMASDPIPTPTPPIDEMGFTEAFAKMCTDAKVDATLLWTAIHSTGERAVIAIQGAFSGLLAKLKGK